MRAGAEQSVECAEERAVLEVEVYCFASPCFLNVEKICSLAALCLGWGYLGKERVFLLIGYTDFMALLPLELTNTSSLYVSLC